MASLSSFFWVWSFALIFSIGTQAVQINVDTSEAPELEAFGSKVKSTLDQWFPKIEEMLKSDTYKAVEVINIRFDPSYDGVAYASGNEIVGAVDYYKDHQDDVGSMIHEMVHVIQQYKECDGWVTEGIADFIRYFIYEPDNKPGRPGPSDSYKSGYGNAAYLFQYVNLRSPSKPRIWWWVNVDCREGNWDSDGFWKRMTGKSADEWWKELTTIKDGSAPRITIDTSKSPSLAKFGAKVKSAMSQWFPRVSKMLSSRTYIQPNHIKVTFNPECDGVAGTGGEDIEGCSKYYEKNQDDVGSMIHEMVHTIQSYGFTPCPGWITEGLADYIRFFIYEPKNAPKKPGSGSKYTDGYQTTAYFFNYVEKNYKGTMGKINQQCLEGTYKATSWAEITKKNPQQMWEDMQRNG